MSPVEYTETQKKYDDYLNKTHQAIGKAAHYMRAATYQENFGALGDKRYIKNLQRDCDILLSILKGEIT